MSVATVTIRQDVSRFHEAVESATEAFRKFAEVFGGRESWAKAPARQRREQRRAEALKRQERHDNKPTYDKLAATFERRGKSARERERLLRTALA